MSHRNSGNRCGHNPDKPNLKMDPSTRVPEKLPPILKFFIERCEQYYWDPRHIYPSLSLVRAVRSGFTSLLESARHFRKMRSERREACVKLLKAVALKTELASLKVGKPTQDGFVCTSLRELAVLAGLPFLRACRAAADLRVAELVTVDEIAEEQADGTYLGYPAIRTLKPEAFEFLGLTDLQAAREYASQKLAKAAQAVNLKVSHFTKVTLGLLRKRRRDRLVGATNKNQAEVDARRQQAHQINEYLTANPGSNKSPSELLKDLKALLKG
jgi:hypothetical protein